jgi:uncharacterized membrane protein
MFKKVIFIMLDDGFYNKNKRIFVSTSIAVITGVIILFSFIVPICKMNELYRTMRLANLPISLICHQIPNRCCSFFGIQSVICSRCISFYSAMFIVSLWYIFFGFPEKPINNKFLFFFVTPLIIDGTIQLFNFWTSTNTLRIITGAAAGVGAALSIIPSIIGRNKLLKKDK